MSKIILISGDPNSINSEIIYKTWKKLNKSLRRRILFAIIISVLCWCIFEPVKQHLQALYYCPQDKTNTKQDPVDNVR